MTSAFSEPLLSMAGLGKTYAGGGGPVEALRHVDLTIGHGEFVSVIGPSGCGKSTLMNIIAGLDEPTSGTIQFGDETAQQRLGHIGYMPQRDLLMPWRSILENVILGPELQGIARSAARAAAAELFATFGLEGFEHAYPAELSGGMRQRAALLRTFLANRPINLLDEPFGKLDALTRIQLQQWLADYSATGGKTVLLITHDIEEAIFLSDRVYLMSPRPGQMVLQREVPLARPRMYADCVVAPAFIRLKRELLAAIGQSRIIEEEAACR